MTNRDSQISKDSIENYIHNCRLIMGQNIREIRIKRRYSQDELAKIMGVDRTTISKIENGKFSFSIDHLSKFSWFLEFDFMVVDNKIKK